MKNISYNMKKKNLFIISVLVVVVLALVLIFALKDNTKPSLENLALNTTSGGVVSNALGNSDTSDTISETTLASHNSQSDCWISYKGKVYDVTAFLPKHAGSAQAIIPYCGTSSEFEEAFTQKHGTSKASMLMKVGVLMGDFQNVGSL